MEKLKVTKTMAELERRNFSTINAATLFINGEVSTTELIPSARMKQPSWQYRSLD